MLLIPFFPVNKNPKPLQITHCTIYIYRSINTCLPTQYFVLSVYRVKNFSTQHVINNRTQYYRSLGKTPFVNVITAHLYQGVDQQHNSGVEVNFHQKNHPIYHHQTVPELMSHLQGETCKINHHLHQVVLKSK